MKTAKHFGSFTTGAFVTARQVEAQLEDHGAVVCLGDGRLVVGAAEAGDVRARKARLYGGAEALCRGKDVADAA